MPPELLNAVAQILVAAIIGLAGWLFGDQRSKKLKTEVVSAKDAANAATTAADDNARAIRDLVKRNLVLAQERDEAHRRSDDLEQRLRTVEISYTKRIEELHASVQRLEHEAAERTALREQERAETAQRIQEIEDRHCKELDAAQRKIDALETDVKRLSSDIARMVEERAVVDGELQKEREKTILLQQELLKAQRRITELEADVMRLNARLEAIMEARDTIVQPIVEGIRQILKPPADADAA